MIPPHESVGVCVTPVQIEDFPPWQAPKRRRGKARTTSYLKGPAYAHPYGLAVQHPGASGKGAWRRVVRTAEPAVVDTFREAVARICK